MDYLVFRLYGAMASWGDIAIGEVRNTTHYPSKSAISGLLAAALGVKREDELQQHKLVAHYAQAVKVISRGQTLSDYHTVQAPRSVGKFQYRTRRDELTVGEEYLGTVLSSREYLCDAQALVALAIKEHASYSANTLKGALEKPKFHLYLGRKSCPLAAPLDPQIMAACSFKQALDNYNLGQLRGSAQPWDGDMRWSPADSIEQYYWEGSIEDFAKDDQAVDSTHIQKIRRNDKPLARKSWTFESRTEYMWQTREIN